MYQRSNRLQTLQHILVDWAFLEYMEEVIHVYVILHLNAPPANPEHNLHRNTVDIETKVAPDLIKSYFVPVL